MKANRNIAIDGDSGSGKSTVGKILAEKLGFVFIDSGLFYRAATLSIILNKAENEKSRWERIIENTEIKFKKGRIILNNSEIPLSELRSRKVDNLVSPVSTVPQIRAKITEMLRNAAKEQNVVMVGRDIGTVVLKNAFLKVYLTATIEERANRRYKELIKKGITTITFDEVLKNLKERDLIDSTRDVAPLKIPKDAYVIDTTGLTIDEVVNRIMQFYGGKEYALRTNPCSSKSNI